MSNPFGSVAIRIGDGTSAYRVIGAQGGLLSGTSREVFNAQLFASIGRFPVERVGNVWVLRMLIVVVSLHMGFHAPFSRQAKPLF